MRASTRAAIAVPTVLAVLGLAACGNDAGGDGDAPADGAVSGEVTMRVYPLMGEEDAAFWEEHIATFQEEFPDVDVTIDVQPWADRDRALTAAIAGNVGPDVVYMIPDELAQFQAQGVLQPLTDVIEQDSFRENALTSVSIDGDVYGAPILMSAVPGICDAQVLDAAGAQPPTTWDELLELGEQVAANGHYATHLVISNESTLNTTFYPLVWQAGGSPFAEDGTPTIDSPEMLEALEFVIELADNGYVNRDESAMNLPAEQSPIGRREVACIYNVDPVIIEPLWGDDAVVAPPLTNVTNTIYGTIGAYAMLNTAEDQEAAAAWIQHITSPEVMSDLTSRTGYYPTREDAEVTFEEGSVEAEVEQYLDLTNAGPIVPGAREVQGAVAPELQAAFLGSKTAEQALADAQAAAEAVLAD